MALAIVRCPCVAHFPLQDSSYYFDITRPALALLLNDLRLSATPSRLTLAYTLTRYARDARRVFSNPLTATERLGPAATPNAEGTVVHPLLEQESIRLSQLLNGSDPRSSMRIPALLPNFLLLPPQDTPMCVLVWPAALSCVMSDFVLECWGARRTRT
jgi:hypothetical protein